MALTGLHTNWKLGSYEADRNLSIKIAENDPLRNGDLTDLKPYYDPKGLSLAIGYGFDLLVRSNAEINTYLTAVGLAPLSAQDATLLTQARAKRTAGTATSTYLTGIASQLNLNLGSEPTATLLLDAYITNVAEKNVDSFLSKHGLSIPPSEERAALVSLAYNNPALLGVGLAMALVNGDRAEAWYQIRYQSNGGASQSQGIANRRYRESDLFGLYGTASVDDVEARQVYQMYTKHADTMMKYDASNGGIPSLTQSLNSAAAFLINKYGQGQSFSALNVWVADTPGFRTGSGVDRANDAGADLIIGGFGNDTLIGGSGNDTFVYIAPVAGQPATVETINGSRGHGQGSVEVGGVKLTGGIPLLAVNNTWVDSNGDQYIFDPTIGTLTISQGLLGTNSGNQIVIQNFDLNKAQTDPNGYLGIKLGEQLAIAADTSPVSPFSSAIPANQTADVLTGNVKTFTIYASAASSTAQTIQLALAGGNAANLAISTGANLLSFANGSVQLTIPAGQAQATFTLVDLTNTNQIDTATLTATLNNANGSVTSNTLAITFDHPTAGIPATPYNPITGTPSSDGTYTQYTGDGANDIIIGGTGQDVITAGNGANLIVGNGGQDVIIAGSGNNRIYADTQVDLAQALAQQKTATASGQKGDLIAVGDGDNTLVGSNGNDAIFVGQGNNALVLGAGQTTVVGGVETASAQLNWSEVNNVFNNVNGASAPFTAPASYHGSTFNGVPVGVGNDTLFGGTGNSQYWLSNGNNWLDAGGGNDFIQAGLGNNTLFGGSGNDTVFGGGGNNTIDTESGNDFVIAEGGNSTIIGGSGNDTLIGGTGNASIYGGNGNEYIVGGEGNVSIVGGSGNDTIYAGGAGRDTIWAGDGNATVYGGNGSDVIVSGAGNVWMIAKVAAANDVEWRVAA